ncbi:MAG: GNAT family N-acetyltransferase [Actinobacteria bacterium]|nr:GNAT family N-acetyltransferase [Actinomycetota bacterium]
MHELAIRDAEPADMAVLREVFQRASLSNEGDRASLLAHPEALELSDAGVTDGRTRVAEADGRIIGFATWLSTGEVTEIEDMFVDPEFMRRGVGRALVVDQITLAERRGVRRVEVTGNPHAREFYERVGFTCDHEVETPLGPGLRMYREL